MRISDWSSDVCSSDLIRPLAAAECHDAPGMGPRMADQPVAMRAVERNDRRPARLQPLENLALGIGDGLVRRKELAVRRRDPGATRDVRADKAGERGKIGRATRREMGCEDG